MGRPRHVWILLTLAMTLAGLPAGAGAAADDRLAAGARTSPVPLDGDPRFALSPPRFGTIEADPGHPVQLTLEARNLTDAKLTFRLSTIALRGSSDPDTLAVPAGDAGGSGSTEWVSFPAGTTMSLDPATMVEIPVRIDVPGQARPGTHALAVVASQRIGLRSPGGVESSDARVVVDADVSSQLVIRVPGDAESDARLRVVDAPRLVWGGSATRFVARVENRGDTDLRIDGKVDLAAFLGSASRTLDATGPEKGQLALPGGVRDVTMRWDDTPLVGWFQPELVVVGGTGSGVRITKELPTVYVLPPWWMLALVALALALPPYVRRRRRRDPLRADTRRSRARTRVEERMRREQARQRAEAARRRR